MQSSGDFRTHGHPGPTFASAIAHHSEKTKEVGEEMRAVLLSGLDVLSSGIRLRLDDLGSLG